jgi:hypothetical protein
MTVDVTSVFATYLAQNRGPDPKDPTGTRPSEYGVSAEWEDGVVRLVLTFLAGCVYCCMESGCHLSLFSTKRWEWLRRELSARGIQLPSRLTLMVEVVVEEGAIFFDYSRPDPKRRGRYAFAPVASQRYHYVVEEAAL